MHTDINVPDIDKIPIEIGCESEELKSINYIESEGAFLIAENNEKYLDLTSNNDKNPLGYCSITKYDMPQLFVNTDSQVKIKSVDELKQKLINKFSMENVLFKHSINDSKLNAIHLSNLWVKHYHNMDEYEILDLANWFQTKRINILKKKIINTNSVFPTDISIEKSYDYNSALIKTFFSKKIKMVILDPYLVVDGEFIIQTDIIDCIEMLVKKFDVCVIYDLSNMSLGRDTNKTVLNLSSPDMILLPQSIGIDSPLSITLISSTINKIFLEKKLSSEFSIAAINNIQEYFNELKNSNLLDKIQENTNYLFNGLKNLEEKHISIIDINNYGFYFIIRTDISSTSIKNFFLEHQIIVDYIDDKYLLLRPPFCINKSQLDFFLDAFDKCLSKLSNYDHLK